MALRHLRCRNSATKFGLEWFDATGVASAESKPKAQTAEGHLQARPSLCEEAKRPGWAAPGV